MQIEMVASARDKARMEALYDDKLNGYYIKFYKIART